MKLNHLEVGEFCVKKNITTKTQFYADAMQRKDASEYDLALYVMNNPEKRIAETIARAEGGPKISKNQDSLLTDAMNGTCMWFERAAEVLSLNNIELATFAKAMYNCLSEGRCKH